MYVAGLDIGARSTEAVVLGRDDEVEYRVVWTGVNGRKAARESLERCLGTVGIRVEDLACIVATGYGRHHAPFDARPVTEITCHGTGAHFLLPDAKTVIDIGGQDSKAIRLDGNGNAVKFAMNDKCAAGSGLFLERMAQVLEVEVDELGDLGSEAQKQVTLSSMCVVFAESEVVSLLAQGHRKEDIIRGIHFAIAQRVIGLARRVSMQPPVVFTGGGAKNKGLVAALKALCGCDIYVPEEPQIVGALGAAVLGRRYAEGEQR